MIVFSLFSPGLSFVPLPIAYFSDWGADLVVIGRREHTGLNELFLGSVSNYVLHHVPCPVLVLQGESFAQGSGTEQKSVAKERP